MITFSILTIAAFIFYIDTFVWSTKIVTVGQGSAGIEYSNKTPLQRRLLRWTEILQCKK